MPFGCAQRSAEILEECEHIRNERRDYLNWLKEETTRKAQLKLRKTLTDYTWVQLGEVLVAHYDNVSSSGNSSFLLERYLTSLFYDIM